MRPRFPLVTVQPMNSILQQESPASRTRPLSEAPVLAEAAVRMLCTPSALAGFTDAEARTVVACMRRVSYPEGAMVMREGDQVHTGYMLLLLEGEVSVETSADGSGVEISVLGPGNLFGEMALLDGEPRSVSCRAVTRIEAAGLSREALAMLLRDSPVVCAKLMTLMAQRLADRLRAAGDQLRMYAHLLGTLRDDRAR